MTLPCLLRARGCRVVQQADGAHVVASHWKLLPIFPGRVISLIHFGVCFRVTASSMRSFQRMPNLRVRPSPEKHEEKVSCKFQCLLQNKLPIMPHDSDRSFSKNHKMPRRCPLGAPASLQRPSSMLRPIDLGVRTDPEHRRNHQGF